MRKPGLSITSRIVLMVCAVALVLVIFIPIWRIDLAAPQYPEGLSLSIHANGLRGNVAIINGLNHYIGMKSLHNEDFIEFTLLPYLIAIFAVAFLLVALLNRRSLLNILFVCFICFGIVAMVDFWKWEYNYGHNLNPDAAIVVPGMAYQPPLIGFKQLLNFGAYSIPAAGGLIFIGVGIAVLLVVVNTWRSNRRVQPVTTRGAAVLMVLICLSTSCSHKPSAIVVGKDACSFCKMTVSDNRFGAVLVTNTGKSYKFDDPHCVLTWAKENHISSGDFYFTDFSNAHELIVAGQALFLKSDSLKSPMGGNIAAFSNAADRASALDQYKGSQLNWEEIRK